MIERYLGSLPSQFKQEKEVERYKEATGVIKRKVYRGTEDKATVHLIFSDFNSKLGEELKLQALASVLKNKLLTRLREEESGMYSVSCNSSLVEERGKIIIDFTCAPNNVEKMLTECIK